MQRVWTSPKRPRRKLSNARRRRDPVQLAAVRLQKSVDRSTEAIAECLELSKDYFLESRQENALIFDSGVSKLLAPLSSVMVRNTQSLCCSAVLLKVKTRGLPIKGL